MIAMCINLRIWLLAIWLYACWVSVIYISTKNLCIIHKRYKSKAVGAQFDLDVSMINVIVWSSDDGP